MGERDKYKEMERQIERDRCKRERQKCREMRERKKWCKRGTRDRVRVKIQNE